MSDTHFAHVGLMIQLTNSRSPKHSTCLGWNCRRFSNPTFCISCSNTTTSSSESGANPAAPVTGLLASCSWACSCETILSVGLDGSIFIIGALKQSPQSRASRPYLSAKAHVSWDRGLALPHAHNVALRIYQQVNFSAHLERLSNHFLLNYRGRAALASAVLHR